MESSGVCTLKLLAPVLVETLACLRLYLFYWFLLKFLNTHNDADRSSNYLSTATVPY